MADPVTLRIPAGASPNTLIDAGLAGSLLKTVIVAKLVPTAAGWNGPADTVRRRARSLERDLL
jgi:hypothetical protein